MKTRLYPGHRQVRGACPLCGRQASLIVDSDTTIRWVNCYYGQHDRDSIRAACGIVAQEASPADETGAAAAAQKQRWARQIWDGGSALKAGSLAWDYLLGRSLNPPFPSTLRSHGALWHSPTRTWYCGLIARVDDVAGGFSATHRTFLTTTSADLKVSIDPKRGLGRVVGSAVHLSDQSSDSVLLCEGLEDALSLLASTKASIWASLGTANLSKIHLPESMTDVTLCGDNDDAGHRAVELAAREYHRQGRRVHTAFPPVGVKDFNELVRLRT